MSKLSDILLYTLGGAAAGGGAGVGASALMNKSISPTMTTGGALLGGGLGAALAMYKYRDSARLADLAPGWYIAERKLRNMPDGGLLGRHSGHLVVLPKDQAAKLRKKKEWKDISCIETPKTTAFMLHMSSRGDGPHVKFAGMRDTETTLLAKRPLLRVVPVPLQPNVDLVTVLERLRKLQQRYDGGGLKYKMFHEHMAPSEDVGIANCHGVTTRILEDLEDLHRLNYYDARSLFGAPYVRKEASVREALDEALDESYLQAALRGGAVGGLIGSMTMGGLPLLYGMDNNNPRSSLEDTFPKTVRTSAVGAGIGSLVGGSTGALINIARLANRKRKLRKKIIEDTARANAYKMAAARDYLTRGAGGAALGAGTGMLANILLGRKWHDKRLLLGGLGVGTALGLGVGYLRSQERDRFETSNKHLENSTQRDADGNPILVNGQRRFKPGWYIQGRPLDCFLGTDPYAENNAQHVSLVGYSDKPINKTYTVDGRTYRIRSKPLSNGQYSISFDAGTPAASIDPIRDRRSTARINDSVDIEKGHTDVIYGRNDLAQYGVDILNRKAHPASRMYALATFDMNNPEEALRFDRGVDLLIKRSLRDNQTLGEWNIFPKTAITPDRNTCVSWAHYLAHGLINQGAIPKPDWSTFPKHMNGYANEDFRTYPKRYNELYGPFVLED